MRISVRISAALVLIAFIALIASGVAIFFLKGFNRNYQTISRQKVPAVIAAAQLIRLTQRLIADAPAIVKAENQIIRNDIMRDVKQDEKQKDGILNDLKKFGTDQDSVDEIFRTFDLLIDNLNRLNQISSDAIAIKTEIHRLLLRLMQLSDISDTSESGISDSDVPEIILLVNRQINILLSLQFEPDSDRLKKMEKQFATLHTTSEILELPAELKDMKREIEYFGIGERNMFKSRMQQIRLQTEIQENLNQNRFISTELGNKVNRLFENISAEISRQQDQFDSQTRQLAVTVFFIPVMTLIGTLAINWHIRQSVIRRILCLKQCMYSHIDGQALPVPVSGNDEISSMAKAVAYFIDKRNEYETGLKHAKNAAEIANRAKSTFLANMSHELRTPLNAVLGFSQILAHGQNLTKEQQKHLRIINSSGEHLLSLINSVLDMSKIDAGRITLNETSFDLYQMLDDLENMLQMRAREKGLELIFERTPDVPRYIRTDETKLRQVIINLLNNAVKFTEKGEIQLSVNGSAALRGGKSNEQIPDNCILFTVTDTGPGIDPEEFDSLFEAFVQTKTGRQTSEGTGLGLPISRKFVQMMGGDITVSSKPGTGTVFSFDIRVNQAELSDIRQSRTARHVLALEPGQPRYRILIVDDKPDNRHLLVTLLNPLGFELREAENGEQAVKIWEEWEPHLIWMDMRMPVMNGYEAARKIKETAKGKATSVIAVTASVFKEERSLVMSAGCDDFLRKPFRESDIFELMEKHIMVRFVYDQKKPEEKTKTVTQAVLTKDALASIPSELTAELRTAAILGDVDRIDIVITRIRSYSKPLADTLAAMAEEFEFDKILEFIQEI